MKKSYLSAAMAVALSAFCLTAGAEVVKIGVAGPLTGGQSNFGKDDERGVRLAVEDLNKNPIVVNGRPVTFQVISKDDAADPKTGVAVAQKLVDSGVKDLKNLISDDFDNFGKSKLKFENQNAAFKLNEAPPPPKDAADITSNKFSGDGTVPFYSGALI